MQQPQSKGFFASVILASFQSMLRLDTYGSHGDRRSQFSSNLIFLHFYIVLYMYVLSLNLKGIWNTSSVELQIGIDSRYKT